MITDNIINVIATADAIAFQAHHGQTEKLGVDYIEHPRSVSRRVESGSPSAVSPALLHDVIEDSNMTADDLRERGIPSEIIAVVTVLTRDKTVSPDEYYAAIRVHPLALEVKLADLADNTDPTRMSRLRVELQEKLRVLQLRETRLSSVCLTCVLHLCNPPIVSEDELVLFDGKPRKLRNERQLTDEIAKLCSEDGALRLGFTQALLAALGSRRTRVVVDRLPKSGRHLKVSSEQRLGAVNTKWLRESGGRPDLVISGPKLLIVVEAKIGAGLQPKQLERYLNHPEFKTDTTTSGGVVLLTEKHQKISKLLLPKSRWLGQVTWRQLIPEIEGLAASSGDVQARWRELFLIVQQPGDLGDGVVDWKRGKKSIGRRNTLIVQSVRHTASHALESSIASRFVERPKVQCTIGRPKQDGDSGTLTVSLSSRAKSPAITISVSGVRRPLRATVVVPDVRVPRWDVARRATAIKLLEKAGFNPTPTGYRAEVKFGAVVDSAVTPSEALKGAIEPLIKAVGKSGALDGYVDRMGRRALRRS